jgi:orotate phosphoribosyltransferase
MEISMSSSANQIARALLVARAVQFRPAQPFTFASGLRSPVYCDNRLLLGDVAVRRLVTDAFAEQCRDAEALAGPATGGIPWAAWAAAQLSLPMAYVRGSAKAHGRGQQIEGAPVDGLRTVVLEDTISTGESALNAAAALRAAGAQLLRCVCIFTWGWQATRQRFEQEQLPLQPLATLADLLDAAAQFESLSQAQRATIERWTADPQGWSPDPADG